mmetsp:Transcript_18011/g.28689  ORF Transcript_18011/g.28689 Transcript_18011/m.28689 type:complete len:232 (-) Transcript_18011:111-806(-)
MAFLQKKAAKREARPVEVKDRSHIVSLFAKVKNDDNKYADLVRILRAQTPSCSSERYIEHYEIVFKHRGRTGEVMHAWVELKEGNARGGFKIPSEFTIVRYSRPLAQHDHKCFVRSFDSSVVGEDFEKLLAFLGYAFDYEFIYRGVTFHLDKSLEVRIYQTLKVVKGGFRPCIRKGQKELIKGESVWKNNLWMVEIRAICPNPLKLQETEEKVSKLATSMKMDFYANINRA